MLRRSKLHRIDQRYYRIVDSPNNTIVKLIRALDRRKFRQASGLFVAEGIRVIATARDLGWLPQVLLMRVRRFADSIEKELIKWAARCGATCCEVSDVTFAKIATHNNPQDLIAVFSQKWMLPPPTVTEEATLWIALESIQNPGNLGTIIRTAEATDVNGVILVGTCCDPYSREAVRATVGSIFSVPLIRMGTDDFYRWGKIWPGEVIGTCLSVGTDFRKQCYRTPVLLIMGNESSGLSQALSRICTYFVKIPMTRSVDSLNLSVATALMLYEIRRNDSFSSRV